MNLNLTRFRNLLTTIKNFIFFHCRPAIKPEPDNIIPFPKPMETLEEERLRYFAETGITLLVDGKIVFPGSAPSYPEGDRKILAAAFYKAEAA